MLYKNTSYAIKTFYGIKIKPGEIKDFPGFINDKKVVRVSSADQSLIKSAQVKANLVPEEPPKDDKPTAKRGRKPKSENNKEDESDGENSNK